MPADATDDEIRRALGQGRGYVQTGSDSPATPPRTGMFDDLIPATPPQAVPAATPAGMPPLPPGFVLDAPAKQADPWNQFADAPQADPWAAFKDAPPAQAAGTTRDLPPLPPGFVLDAPRTPVVPPLPPGFVLDTPPAPRLVPVDHDPFAAPAAAPALRPGMFDDLIPARPGMFDDLIPAQPPAATQPTTPDVTVGGNGEPTRITVRPEVSPQRSFSFLPSSVEGAARDLRVGAQGVAKGLMHTAAMPFDLAAGAQNLVTSGVNKLFGTEIPQATPASQMAESAAAPFMLPEKQMSPSERLFENVSDYGTQGLTAGTALAAHAPQLATRAMPAATSPGRAFDTLTRSYTAAPARTVVGDAISGAGAGAGATAAKDYYPDNPVAQIVGPLVGGVGAAGAQALVEGVGGMLRNLATRHFTPPPREIPFSPTTNAPYRNADIDRAAVQLQSASTGAPRAVAQDIRENAAELSRPTRPGETPVERSQMPTSGLLSRDPGLVTLEGGARSKAPPTFIQRDKNVKEAAAQRVEGLRDPEADLASVFRRAAQERENRLAPAEAELRQRTEDLAARDNARQHQGAEFGVIANTDAKAIASRNLDRAVVDQNYVPAREQKNAMFDNAPGRADQLPADDVFAAADRVLANNNVLRPDQQIPGDLLRRIEALRPQMETQESRVLDSFGQPMQREVNVGGLGTAAGADLADLRKYIATAREQAQRVGNYDLADSLGTLGSAVNRTIENSPGYAEANANYRQFADRFRPERNDEMAKFTREIDRGGQQPDGTLNRGGTPPSETAGRFLSSSEKAQTLQRVLNGAPSEQAGQAAVRDYMRSDFASSSLNADGSLNPARATAWTRNNADVLAQLPPALRAEFDGIVRAAQRGQDLSTEARGALENVRRARRATEAEIDRSAVGTLLREDPRDVAAGLLKGGYSSERKLDEINALVKNDEVAKRGWKAAVSEVLADKVQGSRMVGEAPEVQFARLAKEFKDNEKLLAKTFSPEEMNGLRQAHKLLEYFKEAEKRATSGSNTAGKWSVPVWAQLMIRHVKGDLVGGGIVKRFKLLLDMLPTNKQTADEIVNMAWFNPDVAAYLLDRPIKNPNVPAYNVNLRRLIAAANAARESGPTAARK